MPAPDRPLVDVAVVAAGGALGSLARWALTGLPGPGATLLTNLTGCFLLGLLSGWLLVHRPMLRRFAGIGVLGGYTTFSTHLLDAGALDGRLSAAAYLAVTLAGGLVLASGGLILGHRLERR